MNAQTTPMSMASVGYALFALQQSVPVDQLEPIRFNLNGTSFTPQMNWNPGAPHAAATVVVDQENEGAMPAPMGGEVLVMDPNAAPVGGFDTARGVNSMGVFGGDIPGAPSSPPAFLDADAVPPVEEIIEEVPDEHDMHKPTEAPRASVQIGLLRELSFLDG